MLDSHLVVWLAVVHLDINTTFRDPVEPVRLPTGA